MKSILIAEGNSNVAEMLACLFASDGWTVTLSRDALDAADALRGRAHYDAVLVSNRLEGLNGVDLITRTRALDHRTHLPIVMLTGTVEVALAAAALAAGADGVLYKPADPDIIVATLEKCVEERAPPNH
jgi:DNA-binding response OmpR family regulator